MTLLDQVEAIARRQFRRWRERRLQQYFDAYFAGDFETMRTILVEAEQDPELDELIWTVHLGLQEDAE